MKLIKFLFYSLIVIGFQQAQATHYVGSEITYKCLNAQGDYEVTLVIYRDCGPGTATICGVPYAQMGSCTMMVDVWGADLSCAGSKFATVNCKCVGVRDIFPPQLCPSSKTTCDNLGHVTPGSLQPAIERYEFKGTVNIGPNAGIPESCCNVRFSYSNCCRNNIIQNITPGSFYCDAVVNRCRSIFPKCHSAQFAHDPLAFISGGELIDYNPGAYSDDGDSLTFELVAALEAYGTQCSYVTPYSPTSPFPAVIPITLDRNTGQLNGKTSNTKATGVYAIRANQWRRINNVPTKVGYVRMEMTYNILFNTYNTNPIIDIMSPSTDEPIFICAGNKFCFDVVARDQDIADTTLLLADSTLIKHGIEFINLYNASTRKLNGPRQDKMKICWTPADSLIRSQPYHLILRAEDNHCPLVGRSFKTIPIRIGPSAAAPAITKSISCGVANLSSASNGIWCFSDDSNNIHFEKQNIQSGLSATHSYYQTGTFPVMTMFKSTLGCSTFHWDSITIDHTIDFRINEDTMLCAGPDSLLLALKNTHAGLSFAWYKMPNDLNVLNTSNAFKTYVNQNATYVLKISDLSMCAYQDSVHVNVGPIKIPAIILPSSPFCENQLISYAVGADSSKYQYQWKYENEVHIGPGASFHLNHAGNNTILLKATSPFGCSDTMNFNLKVIPKMSAPTMTGPEVVLPGVAVTYEVGEHNGATVHWLTDSAEIIGTTATSITLKWKHSAVGRFIMVWYDSLCTSDTLYKRINILPTGIVEETFSHLLIYPQPATNQLLLQGDLNQLKDASLTSIDGRLAIHFDQSMLQRGLLPLGETLQGFYILQIKTHSGAILTRKIIVVKE